MFFVYGVVDFLDEPGKDFIDAVILVGGFFRGAGNNQRRAGFVDEDGVDFIDDGEMMAALHAIGEIVFHVVAQIIEAEFVVGAVGDVGAIGRAALGIVEIVDDHAHGETQGAVNGPHPFGVAASEVIVYGDDVDAAASERIQVSGKRGHQRLAFAGFHLGDLAVVQDYPADQLHVEMAHGDSAAARFAGQRERWGDGGLERVGQALLIVGLGGISVAEALGYLGFELGGFLADFGIGQTFAFAGEFIDGGNLGGESFDVAFMFGANKPGNDPVYHVFDSHLFLFGCSERERRFSGRRL